MEGTLIKRDIQEEWRDNYRTPNNEHLYRTAFLHIVQKFEAEPGIKIVNVGYGSCAKSCHFVDQGYSVLGTDLSDEALNMARRRRIARIRSLMAATQFVGSG